MEEAIQYKFLWYLGIERLFCDYCNMASGFFACVFFGVILVIALSCFWHCDLLAINCQWHSG